MGDFGQFTDNGQIIFPPTDNVVPSNPNPPARGFSGHEVLPMVAVFWEDADFSRGIGTTWYQVRATGDLHPEIPVPPSPLTHRPRLVKIRNTSPSALPETPLSVTWRQKLRNT